MRGGSPLRLEEPSSSGMRRAGSRSPIPFIAPRKLAIWIFREATRRRCEATARDGSKVQWEYADLHGTLPQSDATVLQQLALAVADDKWVDEATKLAADTHPSSPVVAKLLEHFASQARAFRGMLPRRCLHLRPPNDSPLEANKEQNQDSRNCACSRIDCSNEVC